MSFPAFLSTFYWCIIHLSFHSTPLNLYQDCSLTIYVIEGVSVRGNVVLVIPGLNVCRSNTLLHLGLIRAKMNRPISQRDFEIHHSREFLCFLLRLLFGPNKSQMIKKTRKKNTRLMKSEQRCYVIVSQKGSTEHDISDLTWWKNP